MKTHNKSRLSLLMFLGLYALFFACNKTDNLIWEGKVLEYGTNKPINNATLVLYRGSGEIFGGVSFEAIDTLVTGADGKYKFKFLDGPYGYKIIAKAHLYYDKDESQNTINNGKTKKDLILDPHAWLRIHVKNVNPVDQYDGIEFESTKCNDIGFKGMSIDTSTICEGRGNREQTMYYRTGKIGQGVHRKELKYTLGSHDTTSVFIEF